MKKDKHSSNMHHKEEIIKILDLIVDDVRSTQIVVVVVDLFVVVKPLCVQFALANYQISFVEPP